ncbi:MAG: RNA polymerase sporulation sigma factor SigE [Lachnospiraceae bacterium]|nr:RNA polymerase sporulation sigma factor SigE [Lachnospiraceae bacterium]
MFIKASISEKSWLGVAPTMKNILFPKENEIHYIGGTDVLPAPLETDEENRCVALLDSRNTAEQKDAKSILIEHNLRLVVYIAKKFDNTGVGVEDLISIGTIGLIKAINTFDNQKKIKLATYASRCIENEILMHLRRSQKMKMEVSIDEPLGSDWDGNELLLSDILGTDEDDISRDMEDEAERGMLRAAIRRLPQRERMIIELRYGINDPNEKEMTQKEVAELLGISQSYISRLEKKIIKKLKKEMK